MVKGKAEKRTERQATSANLYHFLECGLQNVYLSGIRYFVYPDGRSEPEVPKRDELMQWIARRIIEQDLSLTGDEILFLRKRLGQSQTVFAPAVGLAHETLSRAENGHQKLSQATDKVIRLYYAVLGMNDTWLAELRAQLTTVLTAWKERPYGTGPRLLFGNFKNGKWYVPLP